MEIEKTHERTEDKIDIKNEQLKLLNIVCACLIHEPSYYSSSDKNKSVISALVNQIATKDPEFILKLALYVRDDLNIRSTANYLLALSANNKNCQPFIKKYFNAIIRLPSDMLEVVTIYSSLDEKYLQNSNSIPTALRKAVIKKFPHFDVYQLAKYNKERAQKRKAKALKKKGIKKQKVNRGAVFTADEDGSEKSTKPPMITLKQLIRKVHLPSPAEHVMCIVGKKYPSTEEEFKKSGLSGEWEPKRAGKRMKLPTPETWETLLSAKGNKHTTWEELIDHNKLPFMAMLRNLRNMILTGISPKHHEIIINRLTDEKSVTQSRQLPWRFLSAYQAININLDQLMNDILDHDGSGEKIIEVKVKGRKGKEMGAARTIKKRVIIPVHMPDIPLIERYRGAIDTAIRIATMHNLKPIEGKTVIFCDVSGSMKSNKCSTKGNMGSLQSSFDVAILLGLMLQDICEESDFRIFSSPGPHTKGRCDISVPLEANTILNNMERVANYAKQLGGSTDFPYDYIEELISKKQKIDNFIILSDMMVAPGHEQMQSRGHTVTSILKKYRETVNPDLLFVCVDLYGNGKSIVDVNIDNPKNVLVTGFSDNVLRFIAERGTEKQLEYVMNIDKTKKLDRQKKEHKQGTKRKERDSNEKDSGKAEKP